MKKKKIMIMLLIAICIFNMTIFSACEKAVQNGNITNGSNSSLQETISRTQIYIETDFQINLKCNEEKKFWIAPKFSGYYTLVLNGNNNYKYYVYKVNEKRGNGFSAGEYVLLECQKPYYIDIVYKGEELSTEARISLQTVEKNEPITIDLSSNERRAIKYESREMDFSNLTTSSEEIFIKNIIVLYSDRGHLFNINATTYNYTFKQGVTYVIELYNSSNSESEADFLIEIPELECEYLNLPASFSMNGKPLQYFRYTAEIEGNYYISLLYDSTSLGLAVLNEQFESVSFSEYFGVGYKTAKIYLKANQIVYLCFHTSTESYETIDVVINIEV